MYVMIKSSVQLINPCHYKTLDLKEVGRFVLAALCVIVLFLSTRFPGIQKCPRLLVMTVYFSVCRIMKPCISTVSIIIDYYRV